MFLHNVARLVNLGHADVVGLKRDQVRDIPFAAVREVGDGVQLGAVRRGDEDLADRRDIEFHRLNARRGIVLRPRFDPPE